MRGESERPYMTYSARRKTSNATVKVIGQGTGIISINGTDIHFFKREQDKHQVMRCFHKLMLTGTLR